VPLLRMPHAWQEHWEVRADPATFLAKLSAGLLELNDKDTRGFVYVLDESNPGTGHAQLSVFTRKRWLDIVSIDIEPVGPGRCTVDVRCVSSGLFPLSVPGAALINVPLGFVPFGDQSISQRKTCPDIRRATGLDIVVLSRGRIL